MLWARAPGPAAATAHAATDGQRPPRSSAPLGGACKSSGMRPCENRNLADRTRSCLLRIVIVARTGGCADGRMPRSRDASVPPPSRSVRTLVALAFSLFAPAILAGPRLIVQFHDDDVEAAFAPASRMARLSRDAGIEARPLRRMAARRAPGRAAAGHRCPRRRAGGARERQRRASRCPTAACARRACPTTPTSGCSLPAQRARVGQRVRRLGRDDRLRLGGRRGARHRHAAASRPRGPLPARLRLRAATSRRRTTATDAIRIRPIPATGSRRRTSTAGTSTTASSSGRAGTARRSPA